MERVARFRVERTLCANTFLKFFVVVFSDAESSFKGIQTPAYFCLLFIFLFLVWILLSRLRGFIFTLHRSHIDD